MTLTEFLEMNMYDKTTIVCDYEDSESFYEYLDEADHLAVTDFINNEGIIFSLGAEQTYGICEFIVPKYANAEVISFFANSHYLVVFIMVEALSIDQLGLSLDSKKIGESLRLCIEKIKGLETSAEAEVEE